MLALSNFCRIGKGVLTKSIGLQKNYKETESTGVEKLDESQSGCFSCPIYKIKQELLLLGIPKEAEKLTEMCHGCSTSVWKTHYEQKVTYINEKNKYGYQPRLKTNAIKLLFCYHFLQPDARGLIQDVSLKELSILLNCDIKTIHNNNALLEKYGYCYISASGWYDNHINVLLPEYKSYHKTAAEGGRGYMTFSRDLFEQLLKVTSLNQIRLTVKGLLETDNYSVTNQKPTVKLSYTYLRGFMPGYCKPGIIRQALNALNHNLLNVEANNDFVEFTLSPNYNGKLLRKQQQEEKYQEMEEYIGTLNDLFEDAKTTIPSEKESLDIALSMLNIAHSNTYEPLILKKNDYQDLAGLCVQYSAAEVKHAISIIYNKYINGGNKKETVYNFGGLARTAIKKHLSAHSLVAA